MKNLLIVILLSAAVQGCTWLKSPVGPSQTLVLTQPQNQAQAPAGSTPVSTLYSANFNSTSDLTGWNDHPGTQCCGTAVNPYLSNTGALPYHTGPYSAVFPAYSATTDRYYDHLFGAWSGDVEGSYHVLSAPREVVIGYLNQGRVVSAFRFYWVGTSYQVQVINGLVWTTVATYGPSNIQAWREFKFKYHAGSTLTDYWIDGVSVGSGIDSYTHGPVRTATNSGFTISTKLGYDDVQIDDITMLGF